MEFYRNEIMPFVYLTCLQTGKFKTGCLSINLLTQLCRENAAKNAIIPRVLLRGTQKHPDMDSLSAAMDELYGARIISMTRKLGEIQSVGLYAGFIDDKFAGGEAVAEKVIGLAGEILLSPNTRGGLFLPQYVDSEKEKLIEDINGVLNNKIAYASRRLIEQMCSCEDYAVPALGNESEAEDIFYQSLTKHYKNLLLTAPIEIFYCGSVSPEKITDALRSALLNLPRGEIDLDIGTEIRMNTVDEGVRYFDEDLDVQQGKLDIGFRMGECMDTATRAGLKVFNALFGGDVSSRLFENVREKLSLCYYVSSRLHRQKGILEVYSGVEPDKYDEALKEIFTQLDAIRAGDFTEDELNAARKSVSSGLKLTADTQSALEDYWLGQNVDGIECTPEELAALAEDVSREEVMAIAATVVCDAVYFLHGPVKEAE